MRASGRIGLWLEVILGVVPITLFYLCLLPIAWFWTFKVLRLALAGALDLYVSGVALLFIAGLFGLVSLWCAILRRLRALPPAGGVVTIGLCVGMLAAATAAAIVWLLLLPWIYHAVLLAAGLSAIHHIVIASRWKRTRVPAIVLACGLAVLPSGAPARGMTDPGPGPRVAAEWEPALGALVSWPLIVPESLIVEIARDDRLFVMVTDDKAKAEAGRAITRLGIDAAKVTFITAAGGDAHGYPRDWGPFALFSGEGAFSLADPRFVDYPASTTSCRAHLYGRSFLGGRFENDDRATQALADTLGVRDTTIPVALTGGNVLFDGQGTAFSTCVLLNENRSGLGVPEKEFFRVAESALGISRYIIVPNFEWLGIQHIDCLMKLLDEETILVKKVPEGHPDHHLIEPIVDFLSRQKDIYGRPYKILRIETPPYLWRHFPANYTNSLILNRKVLVPLFGIPGDEEALRTWRAAMPGYKVIGFRNDRGLEGWNWLDSLHCRTRAIWDPQMLSMGRGRMPGTLAPARDYPVEVSIRDYSGAGLVPEDLKLSWRLEGDSAWHEVRLSAAGPAPARFVASIPGPRAGGTVEYFFAASDRSGRHETLPRTAPAGFYSFRVEEGAPPAASTPGSP